MEHLCSTGRLGRTEVTGVEQSSSLKTWSVSLGSRCWFACPSSSGATCQLPCLPGGRHGAQARASGRSRSESSSKAVLRKSPGEGA